MKKRIQCFTFLLLLVLSSCQNESLNSRTYSGFEQTILYDAPIENYETTLIFKNDSVFIKKRFITRNENDTLKFEYQDGIYTYKGILKTTADSISIKAFADNCDECPTLVEIKNNGDIVDVLDEVNYKGVKTKDGLKLNGVFFKIK